jgi:hypothetical protein
MRSCTPGSGSLISIFRTDDPGVLPLVEIALQTEGIEYLVRHADKADSMNWTIAQTPTIRPVVMEVLVAPDVASRARDLVADLENPAAVRLPGAGAAVGVSPDTTASIRLEDAERGAEIASVTDADLQSITSHLDEQGPQSFLVDARALERLGHAHADESLRDALRSALGDRDAMVIRWSVR